MSKRDRMRGARAGGNALAFIALTVAIIAAGLSIGSLLAHATSPGGGHGQQAAYASLNGLRELRSYDAPGKKTADGTVLTGEGEWPKVTVEKEIGGFFSDWLAEDEARYIVSLTYLDAKGQAESAPAQILLVDRNQAEGLVQIGNNGGTNTAKRFYPVKNSGIVAAYMIDKDGTYKKMPEHMFF